MVNSHEGRGVTGDASEDPGEFVLAAADAVNQLGPCQRPDFQVYADLGEVELDDLGVSQVSGVPLGG